MSCQGELPAQWCTDLPSHHMDVRLIKSSNTENLGWYSERLLPADRTCVDRETAVRGMQE